MAWIVSRLDLVANFAVFIALVGASVIWRSRVLWGRAAWEWVVDLAGLGVQGLLIPLLQVVGVAAALKGLWPEAQACVSMNPWLAGGLAFVGVDFLYYWNHRLLHTGFLWPIHRVHHSTSRMDVLVTSRNTLWSSAFVVYLWVHGAALFFLADPMGWIWGATLTACLDLWRHSGFQPAGKIARVFGSVLVLPNDHALHHSTEASGLNLGANLNCWDRLFGTWETALHRPEKLGIPTGLSLSRSLIWPFGGNR
jgi:sterol desaturase/sphingolipid hydroxylase (fatty acid hydroxylase superfamily)